MQFTGEQFIPGQASKRMEEDHLARYKFAARFVKGKKVLDIACGVGYGSKLLKEAGALTVDGVDISEEAINFAKTHYGIDGVNFVVANAENYFPNKQYDVISSFETIEHISDFRSALKNFFNLLGSEGILIISSPNRIVTNPDLKSMSDKPAWSFHEGEFTSQELSRELELCGFVVREGDYLFGQRQRLNFGNKYLRRFHKIIFNPDAKASPAVEKIRKTPRYFIIKALKLS